MIRFGFLQQCRLSIGSVDSSTLKCMAENPLLLIKDFNILLGKN